MGRDSQIFGSAIGTRPDSRWRREMFEVMLARYREVTVIGIRTFIARHGHAVPVQADRRKPWLHGSSTVEPGEYRKSFASSSRSRGSVPTGVSTPARRRSR